MRKGILFRMPFFFLKSTLFSSVTFCLDTKSNQKNQEFQFIHPISLRSSRSVRQTRGKLKTLSFSSFAPQPFVSKLTCHSAWRRFPLEIHFLALWLLWGDAKVTKKNMIRIVTNSDNGTLGPSDDETRRIDENEKRLKTMLYNATKKVIELSGGRQIEIETGKLAKQADGSVVVRQGNTMLLATVVAAKEAKPDVDFMPLSVEYKEKYD